MIIDKTLLFPYWISLKIRHFLFDNGLKKVSKADVPTICVGNITVGGTGKTPHTEMLIRTLMQDEYWGEKNIAVLSRGYKRTAKGFQQVPSDGSAKEYGDEPQQIKNKYPSIVVAVDKSRRAGCDFLAHPEKLMDSPKARKCRNKVLQKADLIILDDAFQHRSLRADVNIVLVDYNRPIFKDHLLPVGRLRDLPERIKDADIIIVSKCPREMDSWQKSGWADALGLEKYDISACEGVRANGKKQNLFFTTISYTNPQPVFPEADQRYLYSPRLILFSGIANDEPLVNYLCGRYSILKHFNFPDHHKFSKADIRSIMNVSQSHPTAVVMTTEKDCQRVRDCKFMPETLKKKIFYTPIEVMFLTSEEESVFKSVLKSRLK